MKIIKWNGKPITKPGIYSGIPLERYHSIDICDGPACSSSDLRTAWSQSLKHMFDKWACNPDREVEPPTEFMIMGSAAHHLVLGEDDFNTSFIGQPLTYRDKETAKEKKWTYAADPCKDWRAIQHKKGRTIVTQLQLSNIVGIARSLQLEPLVMSGCLKGIVEASMFVKDPQTGIWLKWRPDVIPTDSGDYVDLKVVSEISDVGVRSALKSRRYNMQGGIGWEVCEQLGLPFLSFNLIFAEAKRPFCIRVEPLDDADLSRGRLQCRAMLRRVAECIETGIWPGPGAGDLRPMPLGNDERERIDARLAYEAGISGKSA